MAYTFTDKYGHIYIIDDKVLRKVNDKVLIWYKKKKMGDDLYINYYFDPNESSTENYMYAEVEGSGTEFGHDGYPVACYSTCKEIEYTKEVYNETTGKTDQIHYHEFTYELTESSSGWNDECYHVIHNNNIYKNEFWIPDTVVHVDISMAFIFDYTNVYDTIVHIGKNVKTIRITNIGKIVNDDAVNTSLETFVIFMYGGIFNVAPVIKLRNCVNLDYIRIFNDNVDSVDLYVDKKYKSLSKKKWTNDNCLVTDYKSCEGSGLEWIDWKKLFNRSISNEADNYMCVQTDDAVVQIPLYMVQDGQSIDVDNALLIKEDEGVYYCPVTKEKTDKSIMAIQSTDCVYYVDSE